MIGMRPVPLLLGVLLSSVPAVPAEEEQKLAVVRTEVQQYQDGPPIPGGFQFFPGDTVYFTFRVAGFQITEQDIARIGYEIDAFDPEGLMLQETVSDEVAAELTRQDKKNEWMPIVRYDTLVPPTAPSGEYRLAVRVTDAIGKTATQKEVRFRVKGKDLEASDSLVIRDFAFYRTETATSPLVSAVYRPGDSVWARFDMTGYEFGDGNKFSIEYGIKVLRASGKMLFEQPVAASEEDESFYPQRYIPGSLSLNLTADLEEGEYTIIVNARDKIGEQTCETTQVFEVR